MTSYLYKFNSKKFHLYSNGKFVILNTTKTDERSGILASLRQNEKKLCREDVQKTMLQFWWLPCTPGSHRVIKTKR